MMSRATGPRGNEEVMVKGRHPAGRAEIKSSTGRHAQKIGEVSEEEAAQEKGKRVVTPIGLAAFVLAAAVGTAVACGEGGGLKDPQDAGWDTGGDVDTDTDSDVDTDTDSDTDTGAPVCEQHTGPLYDYEAKLAVGGKARLTVEGHEMEVVALDFANQIVEAFITDGDGNPIMNGDSYFIFYSEESMNTSETTITLELGDEVITLTLCIVFEVPEGVESDAGESLEPGVYAKIITDAEYGFVHCLEVDNGTTESFTHEVNGILTQTILVGSHHSGEWGDPECTGTTTEFSYEISTFDPYLTDLGSVPGPEAMSTVKIRGAERAVLDVLEVDGEPSVRVGDEVDFGILNMSNSLSHGDFTAELTGELDSQGRPVFAYYHPTAAISEEDVSFGEKKIQLWDGDELIGTYHLRFESGDAVSGVGASLLKDVQELYLGAIIEIGGQEYMVTVMDAEQVGEYLRVDSWKLVPYVAEE